MSGKFHQPQLWVKKTVVNNPQQQTTPPNNTNNNTQPTINTTTTPSVASGSDQSSSTQPSNQSPTSSSANNNNISASSSAPKITSTLKHNATPFTPQNFVPIAQSGAVPQPVPTTTSPQPVPTHQPPPKKNHPKKQHQKANQNNNNQQNNQQNNVGNSNNNNNNNNEQHYGSLLKNKTKVIVRNIPYNFTEQDFIVKCVPKSFVTEQVKQVPPPVTVTTPTTPTTSEPSTPTLPEIPHFIYDPKKITWSDFHPGHKTITQVFSSVSYLNFASVALLHQFKNEFSEELKSKQSVALSSSVQITDDDVDESPLPALVSNTPSSIWRETPMTIEYCPLQMVPKPKKKDPRDGTIFKDEHYSRFLEQLKQPKDLTLQPLSLDNSSTTSGIGLDGGESSDGSTSSKKLGTNVILALGGVGASSSYTKKTDEPIISPLLKELLEKKNKKGNNPNDPNKPKGNNPKKSGKPQYKRKY